MPDKDGDGRADTVYKAADGFHWPHSVAFYQGALFVADDFAIYRASKTGIRMAFTRSAPFSPKCPALWAAPQST